MLVWLGYMAVVYAISALVAYFAWLPFAPSYPLWETLAAMPVPTALGRLAGFDGVYYVTIAQNGYVFGGTQAFFPLYPLLMAALAKVGINPVAAGLAISSVAGFVFLDYFYRLVAAWSSPRVAWVAIATVLASPVAFYLVSVYTESLFLALFAWALWSYRREHYWTAALGCALLSATRIVGVCLPTVLILREMYLFFKQSKTFCIQNIYKYRQNLYNIAILCLGFSGLFVYMGYLGWRFGDPLLFMSVQSSFGSGRETAQLVLLPQVLWRYGKMLVGGLPYNLKSYAIVQELVISLLYLAGLLAIVYRNFKAKKAVFPRVLLVWSIFIYLIPPLTGNLSSMPRYLLPCLIVNLLVAKFWCHSRKITGLAMIASVLGQIFNLCLFVQGFWVA